MPIYEYECASCHRTFEVWKKMSEGPVTKCQHCGSKKVSKLISSSTFHLKGSGWYITDYARKGKSDPKSEPKTDSKTDSKMDSKTESKTESKTTSDSSSSHSSSSSKKKE